MKTPIGIFKPTWTALRPLLSLFVLSAIVAVAVVALPTSPTGAQEPTPTAEPVRSAPVIGISVRSSRGLMTDGTQGLRTVVAWEKSNPGEYHRVGYANLSQFLATAKDNATWSDAVQWRSMEPGRRVRWVMFGGRLTPGDLYAFTVTAASDSTSEQHWPDPNWVVYRVHGGDITTPDAIPEPTPAVEPTPTPTGPSDYCDTPFAPLLPQCN